MNGLVCVFQKTKNGFLPLTSHINNKRNKQGRTEDSNVFPWLVNDGMEILGDLMSPHWIV